MKASEAKLEMQVLPLAELPEKASGTRSLIRCNLRLRVRPNPAIVEREDRAAVGPLRKPARESEAKLEWLPADAIIPM